MAIKYINIFQSKAIQNLPKSGFLVWKQTIWQPCSTSTRNLYPHIHTLPPEHLENPGYLPPAKVHFTRESFECLSGSIVSEKGMSQKSVNLWPFDSSSMPMRSRVMDNAALQSTPVYSPGASPTTS
jgi:hypothetical protein